MQEVFNVSTGSRVRLSNQDPLLLHITEAGVPLTCTSADLRIASSKKWNAYTGLQGLSIHISNTFIEQLWR